MNKAIKYIVCKAVAHPKKALAAAVTVLEELPVLAVIGAVGAAGYGLVQLIKKNGENKKETA